MWAGYSLLILVQVTAIGLMTIPAWLLGGIAADTQFWLFVVAACAMLACWAICLGRAAASHPLPVALVPPILAICFGTLQILPLPSTVHRRISDRTERWWRDLAPNVVSLASPASNAIRTAGEAPSRGRSRAEGMPAAASSEPEMAKYDAFAISLYPASTRRDVYLLALGSAAFLLGVTVFAGRVAFFVAGVVVALNGAALSFFGLVQQLTWNGQLYGSVPLTGGGVPFASYVNRNNASGFLNICLGCAIALSAWLLSRHAARGGPENDRQASLGIGQNLWAAVRRLFGRMLWALSQLDAATLASLTAAACIAAGILCSLSRGGTVAMIGAAVISFGFASLAGQKRPARMSAVILCAAAACLLVAYLGRSATVTQRLATIFDEPTLQAGGRLVNWKDGWRAAKDLLPVGSGLGTYRYAYRAYQQRPYDLWYYHAENQYLEALVEAGLPGLCLLLTMIGLVALACWRLLKRAPDPATYALGLAGTFALSSQAIHAAFDFGLYLPANMLLLALVCGAVCGRARGSKAAVVRRPTGPHVGGPDWSSYHHCPPWRRPAV